MVFGEEIRKKEKRRRTPPDRLGKILEDYLSRAGLDQRIREQRILDAWAGMVGNAIAEMTEPVRLRGRILQIKVSNSVWMHELQFHKKLIIQKLNQHVGDPIVQDLWFFIGEKEPGKVAPPGGEKQKREKESEDLSKEEKNRIEREIGHLADAEMKGILFGVFSKALICEKRNRQKN